MFGIAVSAIQSGWYPSAPSQSGSERLKEQVGDAAMACNKNDGEHEGFPLVPDLPLIALVQIRPQPALGHRQLYPAPGGVILQLIATDSGDAEILGRRMPKIKP